MVFVAAIDPERLNPDPTGELAREWAEDGPDRPGTGGRYDGARISQARYHYARDPGLSIAGAFEKVGLPKELAYRMRMDGRWDAWEFNEYRATFQELLHKKTAERFLRNTVERIRRNERLAEQIGQAGEKVDPSDASAADTLGKLARAEAANTDVFLKLYEKPTQRVEQTAPDDAHLTSDQLRERAKALAELAMRKLAARESDGV